MLIKFGVSIEKLARPIRIILELVETEYNKFAVEAVITSTFEGNHRLNSLHYQNLAIDFRKIEQIEEVAKKLKAQLSDDYDIIVESDNLHVEYDQKNE